MQIDEPGPHREISVEILTADLVNRIKMDEQEKAYNALLFPGSHIGLIRYIDSGVQLDQKELNLETENKKELRISVMKNKISLN